MKIRNKSANPRVVDVVGFEPVAFDAGGVAEVDDDLAKSLLEQPDRWESVSGSSEKSAGASGEEA